MQKNLLKLAASSGMMAYADANMVKPITAMIDSMFLQDSPRNYVQDF